MSKKSDYMMINWMGIWFSNQVFAFFGRDEPIISNHIDHLALPEDHLLKKREDDSYEVYYFNEIVGEYLYLGRLFVPKGFDE